MEGAWNHHHLGRHARIDESLRVGEILIDEKVNRAYADECGRKSGHTLHARRYARRGNGRASGLHAEQGGPTESVRLRGPYVCADMGRHGAGTSGAIVEHWIDQDLQHQRNLASVARGDGKRRRVTATGTLTHDCNAMRIDAELSCMRVQPAQRSVVILEGPWEVRLGRQAIIDRHGDTVVQCRELLQ